MDSLTPAVPVAAPPVISDQRPPRVWKFWGTTLWGLFIFAAMFLGQVAVIAYFVLRQDGSFDVAEAIRVVGSGLTISLSVILGLPAVLLATWVAIRPTRMSFADYLALRWTSWRNFFIGVAALAILVGGWDLLSRALGREVTPGFMGDVLKSAQADGALWLLVIAFCVAAPMWEEIFSRGFLYRGWSESKARRRRRHLPVVAGLDVAASAVRLVFFRRGVFDRPVAGISASSHQLDLADDRPARHQQSGRDHSDLLAGRIGLGSVEIQDSQIGMSVIQAPKGVLACTDSF